MSENGFRARDIGLRAQKKILSRMSTKTVAKTFIDGTTASLLDNIYRLAKVHVSEINWLCSSGTSISVVYTDINDLFCIWERKITSKLIEEMVVDWVIAHIERVLSIRSEYLLLVHSIAPFIRTVLTTHELFNDTEHSSVIAECFKCIFCLNIHIFILFLHFCRLFNLRIHYF